MRRGGHAVIFRRTSPDGTAQRQREVPPPLYPIPLAQHEAGAVGGKLWSSMCASLSARTDQFYESYVRFVDLVNEPTLDGGPREDAHESALSSDL